MSFDSNIFYNLRMKGRIDAAEAVFLTLVPTDGYSGANGAGVDISGSGIIDCAATYGCYPRIVECDGDAGNLYVRLIGSDNVHKWIFTSTERRKTGFVSHIYQASHVTYPSSATKVHLYW